MTASTAKYVIPYAQSSDPVAGLPTQMQNMAARMDLLLGEAGLWTPSLVANVAQTTTITLARTYPGNSGAAVPGTVILTHYAGLATGATLMFWIVNTGWTGTATTITGFQIGAHCTTTASRPIHWRFIPYL